MSWDCEGLRIWRAPNSRLRDSDAA